MRRRSTGPGVRAELASEYRRMADLYDWPGADRVADQIEAGQEVVVHGYEVGAPGLNHVRVLADGTVLPVSSAQAAARR